MCADSSSPTQNTKGSLLTDSVLIGLLLDKVKTNKSLVAVQPDGSKEVYNSIIIELEEPSQYLEIDGLKSIKANTKLNSAKKFTINTSLRGVKLYFESEIIKHIDHTTWQSYQVKFPTSILYSERRVSYRVIISPEFRTSVTISSRQKKLPALQIADISHEGLGFITKSKPVIDILKSQEQLYCDIKFYDGNFISSNLKICNIRQMGSEKFHIGANLINMTQRSSNILLQQVRFFDRENIKRNTRNTPA